MIKRGLVFLLAGLLAACSATHKVTTIEQPVSKNVYVKMDSRDVLNIYFDVVSQLQQKGFNVTTQVADPSSLSVDYTVGIRYAYGGPLRYEVLMDLFDTRSGETYGRNIGRATFKSDSTNLDLTTESELPAVITGLVEEMWASPAF